MSMVYARAPSTAVLRWCSIMVDGVTKPRRSRNWNSPSWERTSTTGDRLHVTLREGLGECTCVSPRGQALDQQGLQHAHG